MTYSRPVTFFRGLGVFKSTHLDRKSTRLNSSHLVISYAVFCLKKKNNHKQTDTHQTQQTDWSLHVSMLQEYVVICTVVFHPPLFSLDVLLQVPLPLSICPG